ncbi:unnamed protein product, partial [Brenthis ino]
MMDITGKLINGVVELTKLMAHGAMHEACLIEVTKSTEDEAVNIIGEVRKCALVNNTEFENFIANNNATVLDINNNANKNVSSNSVKEMKDMIRRMLEDSTDLSKQFKEKLYNLQNDLNNVDANANVIDIAKDIKNIE